MSKTTPASESATASWPKHCKVMWSGSLRRHPEGKVDGEGGDGFQDFRGGAVHRAVAEVAGAHHLDHLLVGERKVVLAVVARVPSACLRALMTSLTRFVLALFPGLLAPVAVEGRDALGAAHAREVAQHPPACRRQDLVGHALVHSDGSRVHHARVARRDAVDKPVGEEGEEASRERVVGLIGELVGDELLGLHLEGAKGRVHPLGGGEARLVAVRVHERRRDDSDASGSVVSVG